MTATFNYLGPLHENLRKWSQRTSHAYLAASNLHNKAQQHIIYLITSYSVDWSSTSQWLKKHNDNGSPCNSSYLSMFIDYFIAECSLLNKRCYFISREIDTFFSSHGHQPSHITPLPSTSTCRNDLTYPISYSFAKDNDENCRALYSLFLHSNYQEILVFTLYYLPLMGTVTPYN
ncbi:hypothetical protein RclHR1_06430003 [Rhizophagus clarus]|uniref:Uncharacterized protein n=1 Tax=Rhizophagus clarus TaxID=94130 RepID=A0A2Z6S9X7_9GLOM|nr:hypothetical protein RclHR1_06430003 [Rhizophagus clarus]